MAPRLEMLLMRSLMLCYAQARDLVQEARTNLNMEATTPWTEELKAECERIYQVKKENGTLGTRQQQPQNDEAPVSPKSNKPSDSELKKEIEEVTATAVDSSQAKVVPIEKGSEHEEVISISTMAESESSLVGPAGLENGHRSFAHGKSTWEDSQYVAMDSEVDEDDADHEDDDDDDQKDEKITKIVTKAKNKSGVPTHIFTIKCNDVPIEFVMEEVSKAKSRTDSATNDTPASPTRRASGKLVRSRSGRSVCRKKSSAGTEPADTESQPSSPTRTRSKSRGRRAVSRGRSSGKKSGDDNKSLDTSASKKERSKSIGKRLTNTLQSALRRDRNKGNANSGDEMTSGNSNDGIIPPPPVKSIEDLVIEVPVGSSE